MDQENQPPSIQIEEINTQVNIEEDSSKFEIIAGIIIAFFTAILAIASLAGNSYGQSVLLGNSQKNSAYDWYNTKGIKQMIVEGQKETVVSLLASGLIKAEAKAALQQNSADLDKSINKYTSEKNEIMVGSAALDKSQWAQDVNGEFGKVVGAQEWENKIATLDKAGAKMDLASLFLQICLVVGAISLIMRKPKSKWTFLGLTVIIGLIGTIYMIIGLTINWPF
ncbi:MAG: DUF4337 family protein [Candidatus Parcubacteria bacterium]|nr:DUF4337 family protein [Candidatus Parcubacteria bacterium]